FYWWTPTEIPPPPPPPKPARPRPAPASPGSCHAGGVRGLEMPCQQYVSGSGGGHGGSLWDLIRSVAKAAYRHVIRPAAHWVNNEIVKPTYRDVIRPAAHWARTHWRVMARVAVAVGVGIGGAL